MSAARKAGAPVDQQHAARMLDALGHIILTAKNSSTSTRRMRWIQRRAEMAIDNQPYSEASFDLPKYDADSLERRIKRMGYRVGVTRDALTALAAHVETRARQQHGITHETALQDWEAADADEFKVWLQAREAMAAAAPEKPETQAAPAATTGAAMKTVIAILLAAAGTLNADTARADEWHGDDKTLHAIGGGVIGLAMATHTGSAWSGAKWGCAAGAAKEAFDATGQGEVSAKDLIVTCVAAGAGAVAGKRIFVRPIKGGAEVLFQIPLN